MVFTVQLFAVVMSVTSHCSASGSMQDHTKMQHDSPGILVFWCQRSWRNSNGSP